MSDVPTPWVVSYNTATDRYVVCGTGLVVAEFPDGAEFVVRGHRFRVNGPRIEPAQENPPT